MKIFAIDDERLALKALVRSIQEAAPEAELHSFQKPSELIAAIPEYSCDIAFLDIKMPGTTGLEVAKKLKKENPKINIIFVTGYNDHALEAMELRSSGYVMKPVTTEKVKKELQALRYPIEAEETAKVRMQCFGNFEAFVNGKPMSFRYSKTKELLAYLVDRKGGSCTMGELIAVLWEDRAEDDSLKAQMRKLISDLRAMLKDADAEDVIFKSRNVIAINVNAVKCDYYDYLENPERYINRYQGEYMNQYSWGEYTNASLLDY